MKCFKNVSKMYKLRLIRKKIMKILLITDTQFGMCDDNLSSEKWSKIAKSWSLPSSGIEKEKQNLKYFIDYANKENPDLVIHWGDIINRIKNNIPLNEYLNLIKSLNPVPIYHVPGNHDVGEDPENLSLEGLKFYKNNFGRDCYNFKWKKFEMIFLNSSKFINYQNSDLYLEQINFIKKTLKSFKSKKRIIVFMHHPPYIDEKDILRIGEADIHGKDISYWTFNKKINKKFFNLFENHSLEYIFTGHLHINLETQYKNTKIIVTSALGLPLGNDPSGYRIIEYKNEKLSYDFFKI